MAAIRIARCHTPKQVRELVKYDPVTGLFLFRHFFTSRPIGWYEGNRGVRGYRRIWIEGRNYMAHHIAFVLMRGRWPTKEIDHINGIESDNRWINLRLVTRLQQCMNRKTAKHNTTGVSGVSRFVTKDGQLRFRSAMRINRQFISLGVFDTVEEASAARKVAERKFYGEFARV